MGVRTEDLRDSWPSQLTIVQKPGVPATCQWTNDGERDGGGQVVVDETVRILLPSPTEEQRVARAISETSLTLIRSAAKAAATTQRRLGQAFNSYLVMLWLLFGIGVIAVLAAVFRGVTAVSTTDVVTTGIFAGLSATSFVASFLLRPTGSMADAGPRAAWAQAVVSTYWVKLGYMTDPARALQELEAAQSSIQEAMRTYLSSSAAAQKAWADDLLHHEQPDARDQNTEDTAAASSGGAPATVIPGKHRDIYDSRHPAPGLEVIPCEKKAGLAPPGAPPGLQTAPHRAPASATGFLLWSGPGVAVMFDAESIDEDDAHLVLRDGDGEEVIELDKAHLLRWEALPT